MSQDEVRAISAKLDNILAAIADINARLGVQEARQRPDQMCIKWLERRYVAVDQFDGLHRAEHDKSRDRASAYARLFDSIWKGVLTIGMAAIVLAEAGVISMGG